jgi:hypothetical protein
VGVWCGGERRRSVGGAVCELVIHRKMLRPPRLFHCARVHKSTRLAGIEGGGGGGGQRDEMRLPSPTRWHYPTPPPAVTSWI